MEDEERRKRREQRFAVPISHLEPASRKKRHSLIGESPPQQHSPADNEGQQHPARPAMGYFPPPSSRAPRPRSGTGSSRPPSRAAIDREQSSSPFAYSYIHGDHAASVRHSSDPAPGRSTSQSPQSRRDSVTPNQSPAATAPGGPAVDPFQFMTAGARAPYHSGAPSARRSVMVPPSDAAYAYGADPALRAPAPAPATRSSGRRRSKDESSDEETSSEEATVSDGANTRTRQGARVVNSGVTTRGRVRESVVAAEPPPEPERIRQPSRDRTPPPSSSRHHSSTAQSPVKRKSVGGVSGSTRRRKGR